MFETLPSPSLEVILIAGRALLLIGAFWVFALAFIRWRRSDERDAQRVYEQMQQAFAELRSLHETVSVMSARLEALSERADSDARLVPTTSVGAQRGYDLATRLARNGASAEELVSSCGITRHEADLLLRLHGAKAREAAASVPRKMSFTAEPAEDPRLAQAERAALTQPPPPAAKKRGSLLSVVG